MQSASSPKLLVCILANQILGMPGSILLHLCLQYTMKGDQFYVLPYPKTLQKKNQIFNHNLQLFSIKSKHAKMIIERKNHFKNPTTIQNLICCCRLLLLLHKINVAACLKCFRYLFSTTTVQNLICCYKSSYYYCTKSLLLPFFRVLDTFSIFKYCSTSIM